MNLVLRPRDTSAVTTCVVCRDPAGVLAACAGCGTTTHAECAAESRGCPTIGCVARDPLPVARWSEQNIDLRDVRPPARAGWGSQNIDLRSEGVRPSPVPAPTSTLSRLGCLLNEPLSDAATFALCLPVVAVFTGALLLAGWVSR